jgi:hypothetical protein
VTSVGEQWLDSWKWFEPYLDFGRSDRRYASERMAQLFDEPKWEDTILRMGDSFFL